MVRGWVVGVAVAAAGVLMACAPDGAGGLTVLAPSVAVAIAGESSTTGLIVQGLEVERRNRQRMKEYAALLVAPKKSPLRGKVVMVTGASSGLGAGIAARAAAAGARLVLPIRRRTDAGAVRMRVVAAAQALGGGGARDINAMDAPDGTAAAAVADAVFPQLDLSSFKSIDACAAALSEEGVVLDALINNAGMVPIRPGTTKEGFEPAFGVNHVGTVRLTHALANRSVLPLGRAGRPPRVVMVSSEEHRFGSVDAPAPFGAVGSPSMSDVITRYANSKLALTTYSHELARRWAGRAEVLDVCPGPVASSIARDAPFPFNLITEAWMSAIFLSAADAALPVLWLATQPEATEGGVHWHMSEVRGAGAGAADPAKGAWVWERTHELLDRAAPPA